MIHFPTVKQVEVLHQRLIEESGGSQGVRDRGALESAVAQPQMTIFGEDLYGTLAEKASAYFFRDQPESGFYMLNRNSPPFIHENGQDRWLLWNTIPTKSIRPSWHYSR